jgi:hypothetical protein
MALFDPKKCHIEKIDQTSPKPIMPILPPKRAI